MKKLKYLLTLALLCVVPTTSQAYELTYPMAKAYGEVLQNVVEEYGAREFTKFYDPYLDGYSVAYEENQGSTGTSSNISGLYYAELVDFANDGVPELLISYVDIQNSSNVVKSQFIFIEVWEFDGKQGCQVFRKQVDQVIDYSYMYLLGESYSIANHKNGEKYLFAFTFGNPRYHTMTGYQYFGYEGTEFKQLVNLFEMYAGEGVGSHQEYSLLKDNEEIIKVWEEIDWENPESSEKATEFFRTEKAKGEAEINKEIAPYGVIHGEYTPTTDKTVFFEYSWETYLYPNLTLLDTLSKYNFSFPYPETALDDSRISVDFSEIYISYTLGEGIFLVVGEENGEMKSGIYYHAIIDGRTETQMLYTENAVIEASKVQQILVQFQNNSNILMDYSPLHTFTKPEEFSEHLNKILQNIAGIEVNQYAKQEISQYITLCLAQMGVTNSSIYENTYVVHGDILKNSVLRISHMMELFQKVLDNNKITLSNVPEQKVQLILHGYDGLSPLQITLDSSVLEVLSPDIALEIIISGSTYVFGFSPETLETLLKTEESFTFLLEKKENTIYQLTFFDKSSTEIPRITANISLTLPATSPLDTVFVNYFGGVDNWGGQFDENQKTISFLTSYTGEYQITEQTLELTDLDGISESQRKSIEFMVSKGFFDVDDGYFNPNQSLTRYEFAQALVGMFFALDRSLTTAFEDVPEDSHFYPFVASAHQRNLVAGFTEILYGGDENVTEEQVLTIVGRTLSEEKGYSFPENPEDYLNFSGGLDTSDWAKPNVALCYRDGLIQVGEEIFPQTEISRAKATEYLYRLFMLLYEVNPVTVTVPELSVESKKDDTFALTVGVALGWSGVLGTGVYLSNQSKNKKKKESV